MSDAQKLGRAEVTESGQAKLLKEVKDANDSKAISDKLGDDALRVQLSRFKRTD